MKKINCLVVDDHPLVCAAIKNIVNTNGNIKETLLSTSFEKGLEFIRNEKIGLLILDINLANKDGFDFLKRARANGYDGKVIIITGEDTSTYKRLSFQFGADAFLNKNEDNEVLLDTINLVLKGYSFFKFDSTICSNNNEQLSSREASVLRLLLKGYSNRKIAALLSISDKTVSTYKSRVLTKLNVNNILEIMNSKF
ncbi:response regulator [Vibrio harveyi]